MRGVQAGRPPWQRAGLGTVHEQRPLHRRAAGSGAHPFPPPRPPLVRARAAHGHRRLRGPEQIRLRGALTGGGHGERHPGRHVASHTWTPLALISHRLPHRGGEGGGGTRSSGFPGDPGPWAHCAPLSTRQLYTTQVNIHEAGVPPVRTSYSRTAGWEPRESFARLRGFSRGPRAHVPAGTALHGASGELPRECAEARGPVPGAPASHPGASPAGAGRSGDPPRAPGAPRL